MDGFSRLSVFILVRIVTNMSQFSATKTPRIGAPRQKM
jgi:hypothetical protein